MRAGGYALTLLASPHVFAILRSLAGGPQGDSSCGVTRARRRRAR